MRDTSQGPTDATKVQTTPDGASASSYDVVVVGAGISGLGAAHRIKKAGLSVLVLEASNLAGGRMASVNWDGLWTDLGAEFIAHRPGHPGWFATLASEVGLPDQEMVEYPGGNMKFQVMKNDKLVPLEFHQVSGLLKYKGMRLSQRAQLVRLLPSLIRQKREAKGLWTPTDGVWADGESTEEWLGKVNPDMLEYIIEPMWELYCGWEPKDLSRGMLMYIQSLMFGAGVLSTFKEGLGQLPRAVAASLEVSYESPVLDIDLQLSGSVVTYTKGGQQHSVTAGHVLMAAPGTKVNKLVPGLDPRRTAFFDTVRYSPHDLPYFKLSGPAPATVPSGDTAMFPRKEDGRLQSVWYGPSTTDPSVNLFRASVKVKVVREWAGLTDKQYMSNLLDEVARRYPEVVPLVSDQYLSRVPEALPVFYPGYLTSLEKFNQIGAHPSISFSGDYLGGPATSAAYATGRRAASSTLAALGVAR